MTNEIEKKFFDTFGIEPRVCIESCYKCQNYSYDYCYSGYCTIDSHYDNCGVAIKLYQQITDRILLELICILSESPIYISFDALMLDVSDVEKLKGYILLACMEFVKDIKQQVRALFKKG